MAEQLTFDGQQIGDHFLKVVDAGSALRPPARRTGILQDAGVVVSHSRNYLRAKEFHVVVKRTSPVKLDQAVSAIRDLAQRQGDLQVSGGADEILCQDWLIVEVSQPQILDGYGGRFCRRLVLRCEGNTPPSYS